MPVTSSQTKDLPTRKQATQRLTWFYIASLSAIACLSLVGQVLVQRALQQQSLDLQVVSAAQQQQSLIQQMAKATLLVQWGQDSVNPQETVKELTEVIKSTENWLQKLSDLANSPQLSAARRQRVQHMYQEISPDCQKMLDLAKGLLTPDPSATIAPPSDPTSAPASRPALNPRAGERLRQPGRLLAGTANPPNAAAALSAVGEQGKAQLEKGVAIAQLLKTERAFQQEMSALILDYNQRATVGVNQLKRLEIALLGITMLMLFVEGILVFRPAVNAIQSTLTALDDSLKATQKTARQLAKEQQKSENLLLNILPASIAQRLKKQPQAIADGFAEATVLFADIVGFTQLSMSMPPERLVTLLNQIFSTFDHLVEKHGLEKIKTIGDAYMAVGGLPQPRADHAQAVVDLALDMQQAIANFSQETGESFQIRIGINSGPVVAGVIGIKKFIYDLWGDTVNTASRMESHGKPGGIHISTSTYEKIKHCYPTECLGSIPIKGKGEMVTYWVTGPALVPAS